MSGKKPSEDAGSVSDDHERRQLTGRPSIPMDRIVGSRLLCRLVDDSPTLVELLLRPVVQDAVENALERHRSEPPGSTDCRILPNTKNAYELCFECNLLNQFYTGDRIEGEGNEPVRLALVDSETKEIVRYGHLSCAWTKLSVLDGGFDKDEQGCFTREEFDSKIIRPREGKGKLLTGTIRKQLENGVGLFNIRISDISHCTSNGKFKLGASVEGTKHQTETIRPAASKSFIVKDRRLKCGLYKRYSCSSYRRCFSGIHY